jgi:thiamine biosynthesis lipoprotein
MTTWDDTAARGTAVTRLTPLATTSTGTARAETSLVFAAMGGRVRLHVACHQEQASRADRDLRLVAARIEAWARRLTRFEPDSDLCVLNRQPGAPHASVRPTLCAVLRRSQSVAERTEGMVDVGLLAERLAAETGDDPPPAPASWTLRTLARGGVVHREGPVRFDLDGVAKGWIADRALALLSGYPAALVDADGDIAVRTNAAQPWQLAVADPRHDDEDLATVVLEAGRHARLGVATSGTSMHRWQHDTGSRHHLIDPRTGRPAITDVVQATVIAESALAAESLAKAVVISGSEEGLDLAERAGSLAEVLLLDDGEVIASPRTLEWLA